LPSAGSGTAGGGGSGTSGGGGSGPAGGDGSGSSGAAPGASAPGTSAADDGSAGSGSTRGPGARSRNVSAASLRGSDRSPAARRQRYERRLRARVKRERACLGSLPGTTRELLSLRAGLDGPPLSRGEAAGELGLTRRGAAQLERSGLRELHVTCGGGTAPAGGQSGGAPSRLVALANGAPTLQPASMLTASEESSSDEPRGSQEVGGVTADSGADEPSPSADHSRESESTVPANAGAIGADGSSSTTFPLVMAAILAGLAALVLVTLRRRAVATQGARGAGPSTFTPAPGAGEGAAAGAGEGAAAKAAAVAATAATFTPPRGLESETEQTAAMKGGGLAAVAGFTPPAEPAADTSPPEPAATAPAESATTAPAEPAAETSTPEPAAAAGSTSDAPGTDSSTDAPRVTEVRRVPQNSGQRIVRSASSAAMSAASLALRELKRRRGRD
jgi:hypothetical protein